MTFSNWNLNSSQVRFIEMVIEQLTSRGGMETSTVREPPFSNLQTGGPDALFAGKENVIDGIFEKLKSFDLPVADRAGGS